MDPIVNKLQADNKLLTQELTTNTLVNEVVRVLLSAPTLKGSIRSYFLGINEIAKTNKTAVFKINTGNFSLELDSCYGIEYQTLKRLKISLSFMSGELPDAIFLNKHIIVDPVSKDDPFHDIGCRNYVIMPIISRITTKCWETRGCGKKECPCYEGHNPYCWSAAGAALDTCSDTEDDKRRACTACSQFKCQSILWFDTTDLPVKISADAIHHLTVLNRHMGMVMETFGMHEKLKSAHKQLEIRNHELNIAHQSLNRELDHARTIQKGLLPTEFPQGFLQDIAAKYIPAGKVGGDYYDCFIIDPDTIGVIMADVSGHGIAAALIMSMFKVLLKTFSPILRTPEKILLEINTIFLKEINSINYVTVFYGTFNKKTREFTFCNAGHTPQFLIGENGPYKELHSNGLFVGVFDDIKLSQESFVLKNKSRLFLYTDGITEAKNRQNEMFGFEALRDTIMKSKTQSCEKALNELMLELHNFRKKREIIDDITLMTMDF